MKKIIIFWAVSSLLISCLNNKYEKKGFQVSQTPENATDDRTGSIKNDSFSINTRAESVLLTSHRDYRLTPIFKINYDKKNETYFIGSTCYHTVYRDDEIGNNWNGNFIPGFAAAYGYNLVNISLYNMLSKSDSLLFDKPVLIMTLYYPAFSNDTLNDKPIKRNYYMISAYDEDSNNDGFISMKDLRRFYYFDIAGTHKRALIPRNYSVLSSEYDPANDFMYVFAKLDKNNNGQKEESEPIHIFWIDLANPENVGILYN